MRLEHSDSTAWMATPCLGLLEPVLDDHDDAYETVATMFLDHLADVATDARRPSLCDEADGYSNDVLAAGRRSRPGCPVPRCAGERCAGLG